MGLRWSLERVGRSSKELEEDGRSELEWDVWKSHQKEHALSMFAIHRRGIGLVAD